MKNRKSIIVIMLVMSAIILSGCVSYNGLQSVKEDVALRKAIAANNEVAIKSLKGGASPKTAGVKVGTWEAIKEKPAFLGGCLLADGAIGWGAVEGVKWLDDEMEDEDEADETQNNTNVGRDQNTIIVNGDGNTINNGPQSQESTSIIEEN